MDSGVSSELLKAQCQEAQIREGPLLIWVRRSPRLQVYHYVRILWGPLGSSNTSLLRLLSGFASDDLLNSLEISTNTETAMLSRSSLFDRAKYYVSTLHWQTPNECPKGCTWSMYDCQLCHHLLHWSYSLTMNSLKLPFLTFDSSLTIQWEQFRWSVIFITYLWKV